MLAQRVGLSVRLSSLFAHVTERWDGHGPLKRAAHDEIVLPMRIVHVAQDAAIQRALGGVERAAAVVREHCRPRTRSRDRSDARRQRRGNPGARRRRRPRGTKRSQPSQPSG